MKKMNNIALFTTSSRTIETAKLIHNKFNLKLIVTKTDKVIGRNKNPQPNEVKKFALENDIELIEIEKLDLLKKEEILNKMVNQKIELGLSFDFGFIIPEKLFNFPRFKFVNIHFSLLPQHRGASAVQFAILADEKEYGITYHYITAKLDCGDILYQSHYPLDENLTSAQAYDFLFKKTNAEIEEVIKNIFEEKYIPQKQLEDFSSITYSKTNPKYTFIFKEDAYSDLNENERTIFRKVKAYNPWPILYTELENLLKIEDLKGFKLKSGADMKMIIKINNADFINDQLKITELTPTGKKKINLKEFINGYLEKI